MNWHEEKSQRFEILCPRRMNFQPGNETSYQENRRKPRGGARKNSKKRDVSRRKWAHICTCTILHGDNGLSEK
jgi:hypothetical protein